MNEFKAGDRVKKKNGIIFSNGEMVVTVDHIRPDGTIWFEETGTYCPPESLTLANEYPNPPHKHRDLIIAWANGAEIECYKHTEDKWVGSSNPLWKPDLEYRIKPTKSKQQLEIESIENEMRKLADRLNELKASS